jgi:hypothetical protein
MKLERVMWLRVYIHADDLKPGAVISHTSATGPAKQIQ